MIAKPDKLWYFAYGSNMSAEKFRHRRGILPEEVVRVSVPGWVLTMSVPGLPYQEPSFSSVRQRKESEVECINAPDVIGLAYLISSEQYRKVIASEGGGIAYDDVALCARVLKDGTSLPVRTLKEAMSRLPPPKPSKRYMVSHFMFAMEMLIY